MFSREYVGEGSLYRINSRRIRAVAEALARVTPYAIEAATKNDPQYNAIEEVAKTHGVQAVALSVANALVSYRLSSRGEDYWLEFSRYISSRHSISPGTIADSLIEFLDNSSGNRMLVLQKKKRLEKARGMLKELASRPWEYTSLDKLWMLISKTLGASGYEKTIVFAVKMAYYAYKALGVEAEGKHAIPIPIDSRIALATVSSGIVDATSTKTIFAKPRVAIEAWSIVSRESGISCIDIDTLIWLPLRNADTLVKKGLLGRGRDVFAASLVDLTAGLTPWADAMAIASEILYRTPSS